MAASLEGISGSVRQIANGGSIERRSCNGYSTHELVATRHSAHSTSVLLKVLKTLVRVFAEVISPLLLNNGPPTKTEVSPPAECVDEKCSVVSVDSGLLGVRGS